MILRINCINHTFIKIYILVLRQVNKPEAASGLLEKAAKIIEKQRPEDAIGENTEVTVRGGYNM